MFGEDSQSMPKGVRRALLVAVEKVQGFPSVPQAHKDALRMESFLVTSRGYLPENIIRMSHYPSIAPDLYPSKFNVLRQIELMVQLTSQHDQMFFYYTGHGDQAFALAHSPREGESKHEAILTYTGERIIDSSLKKCLVDPLPSGAKLFALWDCSGLNLLDLEHHICNACLAPVKILSARKTRSLGELSRSSARYHSNFRNVSKSFSTSHLRDSSESRSLTKDDSRSLPDLIRASSPDLWPVCTPDCPMTPHEKRVKANVVSLSAYRDSELPYEDNVMGGNVTKFFIDYLERNPMASYQDLLSYIQQRLQDWRRFDRLDSQQVMKYSSHYRLDMSQVVDL